MSYTPSASLVEDLRHILQLETFFNLHGSEEEFIDRPSNYEGIKERVLNILLSFFGEISKSDSKYPFHFHLLVFFAPFLYFDCAIFD